MKKYWYWTSVDTRNLITREALYNIQLPTVPILALSRATSTTSTDTRALLNGWNKTIWYCQIFNWKGKGHCPSIRKRGRIEKLGRLRSGKGQEGPNSTFENCLQFVSSSPSLQSTRPSHLLRAISHCQKYQTLCVAFEKNWHRKRFLACIKKFKGRESQIG